jgi:hypothetical protein
MLWNSKQSEKTQPLHIYESEKTCLFKDPTFLQIRGSLLCADFRPFIFEAASPTIEACLP